MKRILAVTLTLVMLLTALTGCMKPQKSSGEGSSITLTIAESLPSCDAFAYHDSDPYCFYAYDIDGKLYRVYWKNFAGLNEKDEVIVHYDGEIKALPDDESPSGWTPQYEITASRVKQKHIVTHIQIESGANKIYPFGRLMWSRTENEDGTFSEMRIDTWDVISLVSGETPIPVTAIPTLVFDGSVSYSVQVNAQVEKVCLLAPSADGYTKTETTFEALSNLAGGTYYVALDVFLNGNCDPDAPQNSYRYEDVFCLVVADRPDVITYSAGNILSEKVLTDSDKQMIRNILSSDKEWIPDIPECAWICQFTGPSVNVKYCLCGTVMDFVNHRSRKLTAEEKESIERMRLRYSDTSTYGQFSYKDDQESYSAGEPGVKTEGFNNVTESWIYTHLDAVERAKNECTIQWKDIQVDYDADAGVWKVLFYTQGTLGGCQTVYLGLNGKTLMIVYGE